MIDGCMEGADLYSPWDNKRVFKEEKRHREKKRLIKFLKLLLHWALLLYVAPVYIIQGLILDGYIVCGRPIFHVEYRARWIGAEYLMVSYLAYSYHSLVTYNIRFIPCKKEIFEDHGNCSMLAKKVFPLLSSEWKYQIV